MKIGLNWREKKIHDITRSWFDLIWCSVFFLHIFRCAHALLALVVSNERKRINAQQHWIGIFVSWRRPLNRYGSTDSKFKTQISFVRFCFCTLQWLALSGQIEQNYSHRRYCKAANPRPTCHNHMQISNARATLLRIETMQCAHALHQIAFICSRHQKLERAHQIIYYYYYSKFKIEICSTNGDEQCDVDDAEFHCHRHCRRVADKRQQ